MLKVKNKKAIQRIAWKSFQSNKSRNFIAMFAIMLTTMLFCALFTIGITMNASTEMQSLRLTGGKAHASFKVLTEDQLNRLKTHPLIKEAAITRILSGLSTDAYKKYPYQAELRYGNDAAAEVFFSKPEVGHMPESENELATDTALLDFLGIEHKLGEEVTLTFPMGDTEVTHTFTLCGFWEKDTSIMHTQVWLSQEYVNKTLKEYPDASSHNLSAGTWNLSILFADSKNIEKDLETVAKDNGFTLDDPKASNYLETGISTAFTSVRLSNSDVILNLSILALAAFIILLTGYLIIYNIFQISITTDIRFYGLLKTIGSTQKQIRRIVRMQAFYLSCVGIPVGLIMGFIVGTGLSGLIMDMLNTSTYISPNPLIFLGSALFSILTIMIACRKPSRMAAAVTPVEATRYTEGNKKSKTRRKSKSGAKMLRMSIANLNRNRKKTVLVVLSLTLSLLLLNATYTFSRGFNKDRFLKQFILSDFVLGNADYFKMRFNPYNSQSALSQTAKDALLGQEGIESYGEVGMNSKYATSRMTAADFEKTAGYPYTPEFSPEPAEIPPDEEIDSRLRIYGVDDFTAGYLKVIEGTIDRSQWKDPHSIIQVILKDDYGNYNIDDKIYQVGDTMTIDYYEDFPWDDDGNTIPADSRKVSYTVAASVLIPEPLTSLTFGTPMFVLYQDILKQDTGNAYTPMICMANADDAHIESIENFLKSYTEQAEPDMSYKSMISYSDSYTLIQTAIITVGGGLSAIIALVGILNFINAELTSIMSRKRELAMMQSIGMTGRQLKQMLILEGIFYGVLAVITASVLNIFTSRFLLSPIEQIYWFFEYRFTMLPILIVFPLFLVFGILVPLLSYKKAARQTIVERLRENE